MSTLNLPAKRLVLAVAIALLGGVTGVALQSGAVHTAYAADEGGGKGKGKGGGHDSGGGHESGGGKDSGGGHDSGGHESGAGKEEPGHGTKKGHSGHASGTHGSGSEASGSHSGQRRFGGGSGLSTLDAVPEGPGQRGNSYGAGPQNQFRYWGGWAVPTDMDVDTTILTTLDGTPLSTGGEAAAAWPEPHGLDRCEGSAQAVGAARISGRNLDASTPRTACWSRRACSPAGWRRS
jgi:hypothetical protein